ncbi:T9SS type A sorting domain-containing protein [candidate division WOR-3 bacterium]|nr:T9SS type A sorting domain-containing protein [candidate division WOR-3 bacterium]
MKKIYLFCSLLVFCGTALAMNNNWSTPARPVPTSEAGRRRLAGRNVIEYSAMKETVPAWKGLEKMSLNEQENAILEIELPGNTSLEAIEHSRLVENRWNNGDYDGAIELLRNFTDLQDADYGIQWRKPIKTETKWGGDAQIGNRDSIYVVGLDFHETTGNLFAALLFQKETGYAWSVNISEDTGKTWEETYTWNAGYYINDISSVVLDNYFYVGYTRFSGQTAANIRRFDTDSGYVDTLYGWHNVFDIGTKIEDIALTSNADYYNDRIYYSAIMFSDSLYYYWSDTSATTWHELNPPVDNARRGLDICANKPMSVGSDIYAFISYININDSVAVVGADYDDAWHNFGALDYAIPYWGTPVVSSISAYGDTVITVFPHQGAVNDWIKYRISYNGGTVWDTYHIGDTTNSCKMPDVTSRKGDGMGVVYWSWDGEHQRGMYSWRDYPNGVWSAPFDFNDYEPRYNVKPAIERVASGVYGIVYADYPPQNAYFDRSDWVGITEIPVSKPDIVMLLDNYPEPFNQYTSIKYQLPVRSKVSLKVYNITGRLVKTLFDGENGPGSYTVTWNGKDESGRKLSSGTYFYRIETPNWTSTKKMVLLR